MSCIWWCTALRAGIQWRMPNNDNMEDSVYSIAKKRLSFQLFYEIFEILLHVSQRISIVIVWHRQMTNIAIYHWWSIFVCVDWLLIWCWKMNPSSNFENFTNSWSLDICQCYGLAAFPKHNKIRLKMHCIGLTRKWHVDLKPM